MKLLYLFSLLSIVLTGSAMHRPKAAPGKRAQTLTTDPSCFTDLARDIKVAVRENDLAKTQATLKLIAQLNKKPEDLHCLEIELTSLAQALKIHQERISQYVAKRAAHAQVEKISNPNSKNCVFPNASQAAVLDHANAIAIFDVVSNFFREEWRGNQCLLGLTPPPVSRP